ncbi:hypothetical protein BAE44_0025051, partial [Dichanthelium oligosanthes]
LKSFLPRGKGRFRPTGRQGGTGAAEGRKVARSERAVTDRANGAQEPARPAAPLRHRSLPRRRLKRRGVPHRRRRQRVADAPQQDVLRRLGAHQANQHRRQTNVPVSERGAQHRGGADEGVVRRVQHAQHHQPVSARADYHRAHRAGAALLLLRRRRAL